MTIAGMNESQFKALFPALVAPQSPPTQTPVSRRTLRVTKAATGRVLGQERAVPSPRYRLNFCRYDASARSPDGLDAGAF
jgi:hypothetical protein